MPGYISYNIKEIIFNAVVATIVEKQANTNDKFSKKLLKNLFYIENWDKKKINFIINFQNN